jgi:hypothetical protein
MQKQQSERRTRRSEEAEQALFLQLERVREEARLDALVLASEEGLCIAHSGEDGFCEELAALAPFIQEADKSEALLSVRATDFAGRRMYLISYVREEPREMGHLLERTWSGVSRILAFALSAPRVGVPPSAAMVADHVVSYARRKEERTFCHTPPRGRCDAWGYAPRRCRVRRGRRDSSSDRADFARG